MSARVVVGVDGSEESGVALRRAVVEARLRDAVLQPVTAWAPSALLGPPAYADFDAERDKAEAAARKLLDDIVQQLPDDIEVDPVLTSGRASQALLRQSEGADLLVVGTRGRGGFAGLLLGSTSHQVTSHARCPVLVVPPSADTN